MKTEDSIDHPSDRQGKASRRLPWHLRSLGLLLAVCMGGSAVTVAMTGCEGLDYSAQAEGTGIQIVGAIVVLAKYHASERQKQVATQRAREAVTDIVAPVYKQKRTVVKADAKKKVESANRVYEQKIAAVAKAPKKPKSDTPQVQDVAAQAEKVRLEKEKEATLAKIQADAAAQLASIDSEWRSLGGTVDYSVSEPGDKPQMGTVPVASTRDPDALLASAKAHLPEYIAVAVPAQGIPAERGGQSTVMLWNTRLQKLASDQVLVLDRAPAEGKRLKVEGLSAQYISSL